MTNPLSQIRILTSKITQVCQDICDIRLRRLLITQSDKEPNTISNNILTNQSDHKNTWGSDRSRPDPPDTHEDRAEGDIDYVYKTPNHLKHDTQNNQEDHGRCPPQLWPTPSRMTPEPLPYPDPSEASGTSSLLPTSLSLPPKKDDIELDASSMYTERPNLSWNLSCARKEEWRSRAGGGVGDEGGDRTNDGRGLPLSRVWRKDRDRSGPTRLDGLGDRTPIIGHSICSLTQGTGRVVQINEDCLSGNPMFNDKVTKRGSDLF